jgi:glycine/D-amino acid oxidase-like deaminating enzyme
MATNLGRVAATAALGVFIAAPGLLHPRLATPAYAQAADMAGIGRSQTITARATVKSIDQDTRTVTLQGADGNTVVLKVGPEVRNLPQVKVGDQVIAHYFISTAYVLSPPGAKLPENSLTVGGVRARPGTKPEGAVGSRLVVTGLVVAVDTAHHTVSLVDPSGGAVRTIDVVTRAGQQNLKRVRVGDTITAIITEALLVGVEPAS